MIQRATDRSPRDPAEQGSAREVSTGAVRHILVATDGSRTAGAALRVTAELLRAAPGFVTVLAILEPRGSFLLDAVLDGARLLRDGVRNGNVMDKIARQLASVGLKHAPLRVEFGEPGPAIRATAREVGASLIVVGLGTHRRLARLLGNDTSMKLLSGVEVPVLAVDRDARTLPTVAVSALDFSTSSIAAALAVQWLLAPGGVLHLVHIAPKPGSEREEGWHRVYAAGIDRGFEQLRLLLTRTDIVVRAHTLHGEVIGTLLDFRREMGAQLIAAGRRGHGRSRLDAAIMGSTTNALLRSDPCSILIAPDALAPARFERPHAERLPATAAQEVAP